MRHRILYTQNRIRRWTPAAIKCYSLGCDCSKCDMLEGLESLTPQNCQMKAAVLALVRVLGKPEGIDKRGRFL